MFRFSHGDGTSDLECSYTSSLPLQEFFNEIDTYFLKVEIITKLSIHPHASLL